MRRPRDRAKYAAEAREVAQRARRLAAGLSAADGEPLITYAEGLERHADELDAVPAPPESAAPAGPAQQQQQWQQPQARPEPDKDDKPR